MPDDRWPRLCEIVAKDDGLPTRPVGHWSEDKLYFWNRYIDITTRAMVGHPAWQAGLVYVDLFAGPGICTLRESNKRIPGSPLIAAYAPKPFRRIIVGEKCPNLAEACRARLLHSNTESETDVVEGDCNERVRDIARAIPAGSLTLAFIDPTSLHAEFDTIQTLAACGRVDLLILFADKFDLVRNIDFYEDQKMNSRLDRVLGPSLDWRPLWKQQVSRTTANISKFFVELYKKQLGRHLGYRVFGEKCIRRSAKAPLYRLIYASKHERGLEFWSKITKKDAKGQISFLD